MSRTKLVILALLASLVAGGVMAASADAAPLWEVKGKILKTSSETSSAVVSFGKLTIKWEDKSSGTKFEAECKKASGTAELKGGDPGTDKVKTLTFKECVLSKGETGCSLTIGGVTAEGLPGWVTELQASGSKIYDLATNVKFSLILEGCEKVSFNKTWLFSGNLKAEVRNGTEKVELILPTTELEGDTLEVEGAKAQISGEGKLEVEGGALAVTPEGNEFYNSKGELIQGLLNVAVSGGKSELRGEAVGGTLMHISCEHVDGKGWIHNGPVNGILTGLGLILALFLECKVLKPSSSNCEIEGGNVHTLAHTSILTLNSKPYVDSTPAEGTHFTIIKLVNCTNTGLDGNYPVNGTAVGLMDNITSELEFTSGSPNNKLLFGGNPVEFEGKAKVEMEGGGNIEVR